MATQLDFQIVAQPTETTCGPSCLHSVYNYFGDHQELAEVITQVAAHPAGGTISAWLGVHALQRGYRATLYTFNLRYFDPTWFASPGVDLAEKLARQASFRDDPRSRFVTEAYLQFLALGGRVKFEDLRPKLIRRHLKAGRPILTGLSATYLYGTAREYGPQADYDDVRGEPSGHFVVLCGYDKQTRHVRVADPLVPNPTFHGPEYSLPIERVMTAILLGIMTDDGNLLLVEPHRRGEPGDRPAPAERAPR